MLLRYFYDDALAQASYMVGCAKTGEALVIDPMRDTRPYLDAAQKEGLTITQVAETHIHADYVSGGRELAAATGATLYVSACGTPDWQYAFATERGVVAVRDGQTWMLGNVRVEAVHTPGHTPEHIAFMITDTAAADAPMGLFTGDALFVGDIGRPDLLEEAAGVVGTKVPGARQQFATVQRLKAMPDYLQIWPGHGAGSACGKALGAIPSTTLGYEKRFNPAFRIEDEGAFVDWLLDGQPEPPRYFAQMKRVNKQGAPLLRDLPTPERLTRTELEMSTFIGSLVTVTDDVVLMLPDLAMLDDVLAHLRAVGFDRIIGVATPDVLRETDGGLPAIDAVDLAALAQPYILDVRGHGEWLTRHIVGAHNLPLAHLPARLAHVPTDRTVYVQCASGYRSQMVASWLRANGYDNVVNLRDGEDGWAAVLPTTTGALLAEGV
ncbi:MAG: MBL fold metallo-hydrolase [Anaerolineae bacterium]|nr:MBL fold metallo-hydrolase [Anaerolineae bacterium]